MADYDQSTFVKSHRSEGFKSHYEYDLSGRLTDAYDAPPNATTGTPCLRTQYDYAIPGSDRITGRKETVSTWNAAWDF